MLWLLQVVAAARKLGKLGGGRDLVELACVGFAEHIRALSRQAFVTLAPRLSELDVIASRSLELRHEDGASSPVVVRIGRPWRDALDYRCDYEIEGLSKMRALHIRGVDNVQALWLALVGVGVELRSSDEGRSTLEVARRPNALGVGTTYPFGTLVGQEQARALVRVCREQGTPIL